MPDPLLATHPKVFVSYSHDNQEHAQKTLQLAERLRTDGFETMIDQYVEGAPLQGWPRWMLNQIDWADFVLLVCTESYYRRFRGHESSRLGRGVDWEGAVITNELYDNKSVSRRFVPVLLDSADSMYIPEPVRAFTYHVLTGEGAYSRLTDYLAGVAGVERAPLGPPPNRKRPTGNPLSFDSTHDHKVAKAVRTGNTSDLSALAAPGGTMPADDRFYIQRGSDRSMKAAAARRCETIVIKGPRQFGKSSLLGQYLALCRAGGKAVAAVDFSRYDSGIIAQYGRFLTKLASDLACRLRQAPPVQDFGTQHEFLSFLESKLLPEVRSPIVFAFDETDRILRQDYAHDFFSMIRMWHNDRGDPYLVWHKLGLALVSCSEPKLYITDPLRSPFNVGERIVLLPFNVDEVAELNRLYGTPLSDVECGRLHRLLGGHPFLTKDAFYKLFGPDPISFKKLTANAASDNGPFGEHLRAMLSNIQAADGLLAAIQQAIVHGTLPRNDDYYRLEGAGLVRRETNRIVMTTKIYADFFRSRS